MLATALIVAITIVKKAAMKIRNMVGRSPTPNQRIANGIHASGERLRKKLTAGNSAARARALRPNHKPTGIPVKTESANPVVTRKSDATMSSNNLPLCASSRKPLATANGDGKTDSGKIFNSDRPVQIDSATSRTSRGRRLVLEKRIFMQVSHDIGW